MAELARHEDQRDVFDALIVFLTNQLRQATEDQIYELARDMTEDIIHGGQDALFGLQGTIQQWAQENGIAMGNWVNQITGQAHQMGRDIINEIRDDYAVRGAGGTEHRERMRGRNELGELINNSEEQEARVGEVRTRAGTRRINSGEPREAMAEEAPEQQAQARAGGGGNTVSKETQISPYPSLSYGLQETHTTILPWVGWLTGAVGSAQTPDIPIQLKLRMNSPWDMIDATVITGPADGAPYSTPGFFAKKSNTGGLAVAANAYPQVMGVGTTATERPQWRDYWSQLYGWYTVLGCEYEIVCTNPITEVGADIMIMTQMDSYSGTATSTGNVMPVTYLQEIMNFKNIRYDKLGYNDTSTNNNQVIISGTYKPGSIKRNIVNDGDVKTWTATGAALPNLNEILTLNFIRHPLGWATPLVWHMQIKLKYIVQFKDLKQQARYPNSIIADQDITMTINETAADNVRQRV